MRICGFQAKFEAVKKQLEAQEMEVMEARLMKTSELNGEMDDDDAGQLNQKPTMCFSIPKKRKENKLRM